MLKLGYFLPQFKPTSENDKHWGKGFTEWTNVNRAKRLFKDHDQPIKPGILGSYILDNEESYNNVISHTKKYLDGVIYWHYWFDENTRTLAEMEMWHRDSKNTNQKFCLAWANADWTHSWVGDDKTVIFQQSYSVSSCRRHAEYLSHMFKSKNYITLRKKPIFQVNTFHDESSKYVEKLAHILKIEYEIDIIVMLPYRKYNGKNYDFEVKYYLFPPGDFWGKSFWYKLQLALKKFSLKSTPLIISNWGYVFSMSISVFLSSKMFLKPVMSILSGWDNTPRYGNSGQVIVGDKAALVRMQKKFFQRHKKRFDDEVLLIKSVNEWAEGNLCEPFFVNKDLFEPYKEL